MLALADIRGHALAFRDFSRLLRRHLALVWALSRREISDRYVGQVFGVLWSIGHPVAMITVYAVVFGFVFRARFGGTYELPLGYTTFILSGLVPWLICAEGLSKASTIIVANTNLVKQVIFPLEVLPMKAAVASLLSGAVLLTTLVAYIVLFERSVSWTLALLPAAVVLEIMMMLGFMFAISAAAVYFRDLKDFVQLFNLLCIYFLPALYPPQSIPPGIDVLIYANPFSYLVWCYQDVLYFGRLAHPWAWGIQVLLSFGALVAGYRFFRRVKVMFGNVL